MKKNLIIITALLSFSASSFAENQSTGFSKNSPRLNALGSAFKNNGTMLAAKIDPRDITMGYAGQDVSNGRPVLHA